MSRKNPKKRRDFVTNVIMDSPVDSDPEHIASEVLRVDPGGTFEPYRACDDLRKIVIRSEPFTEEKIYISKPEKAHAQAMIDSMKRRDVWIPTRPND
ncbi:hypothetical protein [Symmachiella dynata]|uniref:hypothetical protein n=1 Tax=Symmachiella dynata TaxID=2527995 RepID=UPI0030EB6152